LTYFDAARQTVRNNLTAERPTPAEIAAAEEALEKAKGIVQRGDRLEALSGRSLAAAGAAQDAFDNMRNITGGGPVTDERIEAAQQGQRDAAAEIARLEQEIARIGRLAVGGAADIQANDAAITQKEAELADAQDRLNDSRALEKALKGTKLLDEALQNGPLACKGKARQMPDRAIEALIAGFEVAPELASKAVAIANDAPDPVAVAEAIPAINVQLENGFADQNGDKLDWLKPEVYALDLLKMGGACGPDYFARIDDYVRLGGLVDPNGPHETIHDSKRKAVQKRAVGAAEGLIDPATQQLDLTSDRAKLAVGQSLFHPFVMRSGGAPAASKHMLETLAFLSTPPNDADANQMLDNIDTPPVGGGQALVKRSLGKTDAADEDDTRVAVVAAMLQSVDQGQTGSCFSTGPLRHIRQLDPLEAMRIYTEVAQDGMLTNAQGHPTPVVTKQRDAGDPLIRATEYTLATSIGREDGMIVRGLMNQGIATGTARLKTDLEPTLGVTDANTLAVDLEDAIKREFTPEYDPTIKSKGQDGRSNRGGYVLKDSNGDLIDTRDEYMDRVEAMALNLSGHAANSPEGRAVIAAVRGPLAGQIDGLHYKPWDLQKGGYGNDAREALTGSQTITPCVGVMPNAPATDQEIGARTTALMSSFMDNTATAGPGDIVQVEALGIHTMNLTPGDPSFQQLLQVPGATMADKIKAAIADPGKDFATNNLSLEDAQKVFDSVVNPALEQFKHRATDANPDKASRKRNKKKAKELEKRIKTLRPTAPMLPRAVTALTEDAFKGIGKEGAATKVARNVMVQKFAEPQVVIADTNWGDSEFHVYFVIAADPVSGEPFLWQKYEPSGQMVQLESKWLEAAWIIET
jgi:hypothetical protein